MSGEMNRRGFIKGAGVFAAAACGGTANGGTSNASRTSVSWREVGAGTLGAAETAGTTETAGTEIAAIDAPLRKLLLPKSILLPSCCLWHGKGKYSKSLVLGAWCLVLGA